MVSQFLSVMDRTRFEEDAAREVLSLIDSESRRELERRAARTQALGRQDAEPADFIAPGTFVPVFEPVSFDFSQGHVVIRGRDGQIAQVPVVREDGAYKVVFFPQTDPL